MDKTKDARGTKEDGENALAFSTVKYQQAHRQRSGHNSHETVEGLWATPLLSVVSILFEPFVLLDITSGPET